MEEDFQSYQDGLQSWISGKVKFDWFMIGKPVLNLTLDEGGWFFKNDEWDFEPFLIFVIKSWAIFFQFFSFH